VITGKKNRRLLALAATLLVVVLGAVLFACSQTPTSVPVRTFERAQRMDVVCLKLYAPRAPGAPFEPIEPRGVTQEQCAPVPSNVNGEAFDNQLFALVTQSSRGELAVVDLSAGRLVDVSRAVPGINFLPVGALPTDVAATPDGRMVFVASAEPNKPAIYGIPTRRVLGDTAGFPRDPDPVSLASWPVCALPQNPGALAVVPRRAAPSPADAGAGDGGDAGDGGAPAADAPEYEIVVVLPGDRRNTAKLVTLDPRPFRRGGLPRLPNGEPDFSRAAEFDPGLTAGETLRPGEIAPCRVTSAMELVGAAAVPPAFASGGAWDDGVKWVDGGVDTTCARPFKAAACGSEGCACDVNARTVVADGGIPEAGLADAAPAATDDAGCEPVAANDAGAIPLDLGPLDPPRLVSVVRDEQTLFIADEGTPLVHVVDFSTPGAPRELPPYVATSLADPSRVVHVKDIALSPPTREYKRFLYAVDRVEGSIMVFDATDLATAPRSPLTRPHPELNPFEPEDRIRFGAPAVAVSFARNDWPLGQVNGVRLPSSASGVLCNPNRNLDANPTADLGYFYRMNSADPGRAVDPRRLRGIFAFATLANGRVMIVDVDDWDAPCRRPQHLAPISDVVSGDPGLRAIAADGVLYPPESTMMVPQPAPSGATDFDPYHAPHAAPLSVTNEQFYPISAPHTPRSEVLLTSDSAQSGTQVPRVTATPSVTAASVQLPLTGQGSENTPILKYRFAFETPVPHVDQDWRALYEGALPAFEGLAGAPGTSAQISAIAPNDYSALVLTQTQTSFCQGGIEDFAAGTERAQRIVSEMRRTTGRVPAEPLESRMADYVQLTDDLLPPSDPYWGLSAQPGNPNDPALCWDTRFSTPSSRYETCSNLFGAAADQSPARDFPIIEAYDDHLVIGRFYTRPGAQSREVVRRDGTNADLLRLMKCCFHHQVRFRVRAGAEWVVIGNNPGAAGTGIQFLSHMTTDANGRCVTSCDPREALLNGRVPAVPVGIDLAGAGRDSPLAMRNPMFALAIQNPPSGVIPARDTTYVFSTRGGFRYLNVNITGGSTAVSPQSMKFIETLGQIGVVDGASQGLVLIDLRAVTVARAPYF